MKHFTKSNPSAEQSSADKQQPSEAGRRPERVLRLKDVLNIFPVSRSTWYAGVLSGQYPAAIRLSARAVGWLETEVLALIKRRASAV